MIVIDKNCLLSIDKKNYRFFSVLVKTISFIFIQHLFGTHAKPNHLHCHLVHMYATITQLSYFYMHGEFLMFGFCFTWITFYNSVIFSQIYQSPSHEGCLVRFFLCNLSIWDWSHMSHKQITLTDTIFLNFFSTRCLPVLYLIFFCNLSICDWSHMSHRQITLSDTIFLNFFFNKVSIDLIFHIKSYKT